MTRLLGLRCDVVAKDDVYYIVFYDIDRVDLTQEDMKVIDDIFRLSGVSYILFRTKHGHHVIGLTPLTHQKWSSIFIALKNHFHSYYGGIIIRLSRKQDEEQVLLRLEESYGEVIPNLFNLFATRFSLPKKHWIYEFSKYILVFEKYKSKKE